MPKETLLESSVSNPSASAMSAVHPGPQCVITWALLRCLKCPHCIPRLILLLTRPGVESREEKTWMLLVAQTSHSEELSHPRSLLPWPYCSTVLLLVWFPNHDPRGLQLLSSSRSLKSGNTELCTENRHLMMTKLWWFFLSYCAQIAPSRGWESWEAQEQPRAPSTRTVLQVGKHHPASSELTAPWATCNFSHSFPVIKLLAQQFAPLICKIVELSLVTVTHAYPWWQVTSEVARSLISEITARKWKKHKNTNDNIHRWRKKCHVLKGAQVTFLEPNYGIANSDATNVDLQW